MQYFEKDLNLSYSCLFLLQVLGFSFTFWIKYYCSSFPNHQNSFQNEVHLHRFLILVTLLMLRSCFILSNCYKMGKMGRLLSLVLRENVTFDYCCFAICFNSNEWLLWSTQRDFVNWLKINFLHFILSILDQNHLLQSRSILQAFLACFGQNYSLLNVLLLHLRRQMAWVIDHWAWESVVLGVLWSLTRRSVSY